jgi:hypothetical protein
LVGCIENDFTASDSMYVILEFQWLPFFELVYLAVLLSFFCILISHFTATLPKVIVSRWVVISIIALCIGMNVLSFCLLDQTVKASNVKPFFATF